MKFIASILLVLAAPAGAAVLIATNYTGNTLSGSTVGGLVWTGDSHFSGPTSTIVTSSVATTGNVLTNSVNSDRIGGHVNVQTFAGTGDPWTTDYVIGYTLGSQWDSISLTTVTLNGFTYDSTGNIQNNNRNVAFQATLLTSSLVVLASGSQEQQISASSNLGINYTLNLAGDTELSMADLGGTQSGTFILRISAPKTLTSQGGSFAVMDNLSLNGTYNAVPEPGAALLGALGVLGLLRRRR